MVTIDGEIDDHEQTNEGKIASFWLRLLAFVIDVIIVGGSILFTEILSIPAELAHLLFPNQTIGEFLLNIQVFTIVLILLIFWLYYSLMDSLKTQGTVGKLIVGLKVVNLFGDRIGFGKASVRFFLNFISLGLLGIGHLFALFSENKQTIHDRLSDSEILRGRADVFSTDQADE